MSNFGIYLNFIVTMVTKKADELGLKLINCHFGPNSRLLDLVLKIDISTAKYQRIRSICCML